MCACACACACVRVRPQVLAINQDVAGLPAVDLSKIVAQQAVAAAAANDSSPEYEAAKVQECGGEPTLQQWDIGVVEPGYISNSASKQCLNVEGCGSSIIYDGCTTGAEPTCGGGHQGFHPNEQFTLQANGQITSALRGNSCMTAGSDGVVKLAKCSVAVTSSQKWTYDKATKELTTGGDGGLCLTASSSRPGPPSGGGGANIAIGRPLHGGDAAILFLNDAVRRGLHLFLTLKHRSCARSRSLQRAFSIQLLTCAMPMTSHLSRQTQPTQPRSLAALHA